MTRFKRSLLASLSFSMALLPAATLYALENWINYKSATGVYEARVPDDFKINNVKFMSDNKRYVSSEEMSSLVDHRPYKNTMKSYVIKFDQTFGPALTQNDINVLLHQEFDNYVEYYKKLDGVVRSEKADGHNGNWGGELYMSYKDPIFGVQSIRARILFNETTRLQQIVVGPDDLMSSYQTRDFFDSLVFEAGVSMGKENFSTTWKPIESPLGSFSVLAPPEKSPPYYTTDPVLKSSGKNEMVSLAFHDPVRGESLFFNVYGYQFNTDLNYDSVQEILAKKHILKQRSTTNGLKFATGTDENRIPFIETSYAMKAPEAFPFIETVQIHAMFSGKSIIVMETMSSNALLNSTLARKLLSFVTYHPEKIHEAAATPPAGPAPAAPAPAAPATQPAAAPVAPTAVPPAAPAKP